MLNASVNSQWQVIASYYKYFYGAVWGARSVMVIIVENEHGDPILNPERGGLYFQ